jgi:hypothetical protein
MSLNQDNTAYWKTLPNLNGPQGEDDDNKAYRSYGIREMAGMGIFSDIAPTPFILESFKKESDVDGNFDPRLDITLFHDSTSRLFYGLTYEEWRYFKGLDLLYDKNITTSFMKYSEQEGLELSGDSVVTEKFKIGQTDFLVMRYADILLLQAEALNEIHNGPDVADELGNTAYDYVDMVRERSNMFPLSVAKPGLSRSEFLTAGDYMTITIRTTQISRPGPLKTDGPIYPSRSGK